MFLNKLLNFTLVLLNFNTKTFAHDINLRQANVVTSSINHSVNPCEDFYSYACGNYAEQHPSPSYKEITTYMDYQYNKRILNLMETLYQQDYQVIEECQSFVEKTRLYLKACRSETQINLSRYFEEIKPGPQLNWPILEEIQGRERSQTYYWPGNGAFDIWALLGNLQSYGLNNVLINHETSVGSNRGLEIILEPAFSENNSTLPNPNIVKVLLIGLGVQKPERISNNLNETDKKLLYILENYGDRNEESLELFYGNLKRQYPNLNLNSYLKKLLDRDLEADTLITLRNPSYFQYLNEKMGKLFRKTELCTYLMIKFLYFLAEDSTTDFKTDACVKDLRNKFDLAVNFLYNHHIFSAQAEYVERDIEQLLSNIFLMFYENFQNNNLNLTNSELKFLIDKLKKIRLNVGNLPEDVTFLKVEEFYGSVPPLSKNNYFKNQLLMLKHRFSKSQHYPQTQNHFIANDNSLGSSSGAFYVAKQNLIVLPYGSLSVPMYDPGYLNIYKYSLLGFILAHELTHAFDTHGLNFDGQGHTLPETSSIIENRNFLNSLKCLQTQLPTDSIEERMADIVAIHIVDKIYKFNEFDKNWQKYFYLSLAQFFCGKNNVKFIDHDTDAERLNQIIMNSEEFGKTFNCPVHSRMNPWNKCRLY